MNAGSQRKLFLMFFFLSQQCRWLIVKDAICLLGGIFSCNLRTDDDAKYKAKGPGTCCEKKKVLLIEINDGCVYTNNQNGEESLWKI